MKKVDQLLIIATQSIKAVQGITDTKFHSEQMDRVVEFINNNFDPADIEDAGIAVAVAILCLRGTAYKDGFEPMCPCTKQMQHFGKFVKLFGHLIICDKGELPDVWERVQKVLEGQYHDTITSYAMSECVVNELQKVA